MPPQTFDYIFVGGGTAGLAAASRMAELSPLSILIIEAGQDISAKADVRIPALYVQNLGNPEVDWSFFSTPQSDAGGRTVFLPRGKSVGGTSNLNFMQMNRAMKEEYDSFQQMGSEGWSWQDLLPYFKQSENLTATAEDQRIAQVTIDPSSHGTDGPVGVSLPSELSTPHKYFFKAMNELEVPTNPDSSSGDNRFTWTSPATVDATTRTRVSADTAYLKGSHKNLTVISGARVTRVLFKSGIDGNAVAEAVEYIKDKTTAKVLVSKEVIISAGAYQTPQILEQSGVGDPTILSKYNIPTIVDLPSVGTNLREAIQEHVYAALSFEMRPEFESWDVLRDPAVAAEEAAKFQTEHKGKLTVIPFAFSFLPISESWSSNGSKEIERKMTSSPSVHPFFHKMVEIQKEWMKNVPFLEILLVSTFMPSDVKEYEEGKNYYTLAACLSHPLSQGTVHIQSSDFTSNPAIDPNFLSHPLDIDVIVDGMKYCRKIADTEAFKAITVGEVSPGTDIASDDDLKGFVRRNLSPVFHPIGTAAMLPKEYGGVVNNHLKVYGTANLRVIDASILPMHFSAHPMATLYAIAEKAAALIAEAV